MLVWFTAIEPVSHLVYYYRSFAPFTIENLNMHTMNRNHGNAAYTSKTLSIFNSDLLRKSTIRNYLNIHIINYAAVHDRIFFYLKVVILYY